MKKLVTILILLASLQPAFARDMVLGYEYDITREKVPTEATLRRVADIGASLIRAGNAYLRAFSPTGANGTLLYRLSSNPKAFKMPEHLTIRDFESAVSWLREAQAMRDLAGAPDWVKDDVALLDLLTDFVARRVAGEKGPLADVYRERYTELWLRQNRPGGVEESIRKVFGEK